MFIRVCILRYGLAASMLSCFRFKVAGRLVLSGVADCSMVSSFVVMVELAILSLLVVQGIWSYSFVRAQCI